LNYVIDFEVTQIFQTHYASAFLLKIAKPVQQKSERKMVDLWPNADSTKI